MSAFRFGCGEPLTTFVMRGLTPKEVTVKCGSTSYTGGVNQCDACARKHPVIEPLEDESDADWFARNEDHMERRNEE